MKAISARRKDALFLPMSYDQAKHQFLVEEAIANAQRYFLAGADKFPDLQRWTNEFLEALSWARLSEQIFRIDKWSLCQG